MRNDFPGRDPLGCALNIHYKSEELRGGSPAEAQPWGCSGGAGPEQVVCGVVIYEVMFEGILCRLE